MGNAVIHRQAAPGGVFHRGGGGPALEFLRQGQQALGGVLAAVEEHILDALAQGRGDVLIDGELARIDDAHVHARLDGVEQEDAMHGFTNLFVATKREAEIRHTARDMGIGVLAADDLARFDKGLAVFIMLFQPGGHRKDVGVENDVFRREVQLFGQQPVGPVADLDLAFLGVRLPDLIERHHHHGGAKAHHFPGVLKKGVLAFLERDGVDDHLALAAFQAGANDLPLGAVNHQRDL